MFNDEDCEVEKGMTVVSEGRIPEISESNLGNLICVNKSCE